MRTVALFAALIAFFAGCATTNPQNIDVSKRTRTYTASKPRVMQACISYCDLRSFPIENVNNEVGIINTGYKNTENVLSEILVGPSRAKLNFNVRAVADSSTKVVLTAVVEQGAMFGSWKPAKGTESQALELYNIIFDQIQHLVDDPDWTPPPK